MMPIKNTVYHKEVIIAVASIVFKIFNEQTAVFAGVYNTKLKITVANLHVQIVVV